MRLSRVTGTWADSSSPFFLRRPHSGVARSRENQEGGTRILSETAAGDTKPTGAARAGRPGWREAIEQTVTGLGYELVEIERSGRGLLRVFIDRLPGRSYASGGGEFVTVDDCETVTRQLQYALEVDSVAYERLEVSSPGLDRPLKREADFERFAGQEISLTLKLPFNGRKVWKGRLERTEAGGWRLVFNDGKTEQALAFALDELREARLVPVVNFKGRTRAAGPSLADGVAPEGLRRQKKPAP
ncbi:MAG: ribosome maturation factor RimP [Burkholderiales bacterium]|nr:ribosome maturation factor RimP [Burkholderiales bacterium]MDE2398560.1 ribosome maturation factor RimP [Burkholderiales bacterium]MDE2453696.1 ribosome maturation factor RimP [Burkholderiales bacterium]